MRTAIVIVTLVIAAAILTSCGVVAFADSTTDRKTPEGHLVDAVVKDGEIYTVTPFFGGDTSETVKGYVLTVYDDFGIRYYCAYVELEHVNADGLYTSDEVEVDADEFKRELILGGING